jgi:hypothetical protein
VSQQERSQAPPDAADARPREAVVLPDVATEPHPTSHVPAPPSADTEAGPDRLEEVLPEISAVARKVGGFKKLAEIAYQLDRAGTGQ